MELPLVVMASVLFMERLEGVVMSGRVDIMMLFEGTNGLRCLAPVLGMDLKVGLMLEL